MVVVIEMKDLLAVDFVPTSWNLTPGYFCFMKSTMIASCYRNGMMRGVCDNNDHGDGFDY
jgi:hypothetical protein